MIEVNHYMLVITCNEHAGLTTIIAHVGKMHHAQIYRKYNSLLNSIYNVLIPLFTMFTQSD